jgi:hypothetical protein
VRLAIVTLAAFAACSTANAPSLSLRPLGNGSNAAYRGVRHQATLVFGDEALRDVWKKMVGEGEPPAVDFAKDYAILLFAGQHPTSGYSIEPHRANVDGRVLIIEATLLAPPEGSYVAQTLTSPWAVMAVPIVDVDIVRWQE